MSFGGGEEAGGCSALGDEEVGAAAGDGASTADFLDGAEEGTAGRSVLDREERSGVARGRASTGAFWDGDEGICNRGRFAGGGEARRVGEGELESKGRLR